MNPTKIDQARSKKNPCFDPQKNQQARKSWKMRQIARFTLKINFSDHTIIAGNVPRTILHNISKIQANRISRSKVRPLTSSKIVKNKKNRQIWPRKSIFQTILLLLEMFLARFYTTYPKFKQIEYRHQELDHLQARKSWKMTKIARFDTENQFFRPYYYCWKCSSHDFTQHIQNSSKSNIAFKS